MQMKMEKKKTFDYNEMKKILKQENKYIVDLLTKFDVPDRIEDTELDDMHLLTGRKKSSELPTQKKESLSNGNIDEDEMEKRLEVIKNKLISKKPPKNHNQNDKRSELKRLRKLNKKMKGKAISLAKTMKNEQIKGGKLIKKEDPVDEEKVDKETKLSATEDVFNKDSKLVFSKFDFASHPGAKVKKTKKERIEKNPRKVLQKIKKTKEHIKELVADGDKETAMKIQKQEAWKNAFNKIEGKKVKDDPALLYKSIKKRKVEKKKSKLKWKERKEKVQQDIDQRQKKRQENIDRKIREKKVNKLKRLSKHGRVIPGF